MAKKIKNDVEGGEEVKSSTSAGQVSQYLKENESDHYNYEDDIIYRVSTGSLKLDLELGGSIKNGFGLPAGSFRAIGMPGGGKTSLALNTMKNFLEDPVYKGVRKAIYFRSEGRLSDEIRRRSGVKFVNKESEWTDNCLIIDSNVYEFVFGLIRQLILNNAEKTQYFFVIDSADTLCKREDLEKPFEDAHTVAAGALLTSVFFKKCGVALGKRGHILTFISQKRESIKIDPRQKVGTRQGSASGGYSIQHMCSTCVDVLQRTEYDDDFIRENQKDKNSKQIGHWCKLRIVKADTESAERIVKYPIKYGRENGTSVWIEYEVADLLLQYGLAKKAGAWISFPEHLVAELKEKDLELVPQVNGMDKLRDYLEKNPNITKYFINKFKEVLSN